MLKKDFKTGVQVAFLFIGFFLWYLKICKDLNVTVPGGIAKIEAECGITNTEVKGKHAELSKSAWRLRQEALVIWRKEHWRTHEPKVWDFQGFGLKGNHLILRALGVDSSRWLPIAEEKSDWLQMRGCSSLASWFRLVLRGRLSPVWFGLELPVWCCLLSRQLAGGRSDLAPSYSSPQLEGSLLQRGFFPQLGRLMSPSRRG